MQIESRLDSWKQIATYLQRDERTAQRWHVNSGLPVYHVPGSKRGSVFAYPSEIDAWLNNGLDVEKRAISIIETQGHVSEALDLWECRSEKNMLRIIELAHMAISENPHAAEAFGLLACSYIWAALICFAPTPYAIVRAEKAARKALALNSNEIFAKCADAWLSLYKRRSLPSAEAKLHDCLVTSPDHPFALIGLAMVGVIRRKFDVARELAVRAWNTEPLAPSVSYVVIRLHYCMGEFDRVISEAKLAMSVGENSSGLQAVLGLALAALGQRAEALSVLEQAMELYPSDLFVKGSLGYVYGISGYPQKAGAVLTQLMAELPQMRASSTYAKALVYAGLNDTEQALQWLEKSEQELSMWKLMLGTDEAFAHMRHENRFRIIAERFQPSVDRTIPEAELTRLTMIDPALDCLDV
jgi:tetratricopeptide (TPR) repeat protein